MKRLEALRRIWTPNREIEEVMADLNPQSELDSQIREYFSRIVYQAKSITLDLDSPTHGTINWETVSIPVRDGVFKRQITLWWEPDARSALMSQ